MSIDTLKRDVFVAATVFMATFAGVVVIGGRDASGGYVPAYMTPQGTELGMVYLTSGKCHACLDEELPELVEKIKLSLQAKADSLDWGFSVTGVGIDWSPEEAFEDLRRFRLFDEVMVGRNWLNRGVMTYVWQTHPGEAAVPQVVIVVRQMNGLIGRHPEIRGERVVLRLIAIEEFRSWLQEGKPLVL